VLQLSSRDLSDHCLHAQAKMEAPEAVAERQRAAAEAAAATEAPAVHEDNEWQIEVMPEDAAPSQPVAAASTAGGGGAVDGLQALPEGLQFSHVGGTIFLLVSVQARSVASSDGTLQGFTLMVATLDWVTASEAYTLLQIMKTPILPFCQLADLHVSIDPKWLGCNKLRGIRCLPSIEFRYLIDGA